jgi:hypothetical protein
MRNVIGAVLAVLGAAATLASPWQSWYAGRHGSTYKFWEIFGTGVTGSRSGIMDSVFLVFLITAIVAVAGVLFQSRALVGFAAVVALGFSILWMVRQGQAAGELVITTKGNGLGRGVANALVGSVLMLIGALVMTGRPKESAVAQPAGTASTKAYDTGRADAAAAGSGVATTAKTSTGTGNGTGSESATFTPEESAMLDNLEDPPKS